MANGPFDLGGLTPTDLAKRVWSEVSDDNVWDAAAQLGYYFMLALFPLVIFLLSFVALLPQTDVVGPFMATLEGVMPAQAYDLLGGEIERILQSSGGGLLTLGMLGTIWAASSGVASLIGTLNRTYEAKETRGFLRLRLLAVALTLALVFLLLAGSVLLMMGDQIAAWASAALGLASVAKLVGSIVNYALGLAILFVALETVYYFGPNIPDQKWRWVSPGSVTGIALFVLSSIGFSLYVRFNDSYSVTYGSIGAVIVLMLWLYLLGLSIVLGAEVNSEIANAAAQRGEAEAPNENVETATSDADARRPATESPASDTDAVRPAAARPAPVDDARRPGVARPSSGAEAGQPAAEVPGPKTVRTLAMATSDDAPAERLAKRDLLKVLEHGNARVRAAAAAAIGNLKTDDPEVIAALEHLLRDDDHRVRDAAVRALDRVRRAA